MTKDDVADVQERMQCARESRARALAVENDVHAVLLECLDKGADLHALREGLRQCMLLLAEAADLVEDTGSEKAQGNT